MMMLNTDDEENALDAEYNTSDDEYIDAEQPNEDDHIENDASEERIS